MPLGNPSVFPDGQLWAGAVLLCAMLAGLHRYEGLGLGHCRGAALSEWTAWSGTVCDIAGGWGQEVGMRLSVTYVEVDEKRTRLGT